MSALICGSVAYDVIMVFQDRFKNHILPDQIHILNVSFFVPHMRKEFGGCAGNIAYANKLLGGDPLPYGTVGEDFKPYREYLKALAINCEGIKVLDHYFTAQAFITSDLDDNQITAFHAGAMAASEQNDIPDLTGVKIAIVSPDGKPGMLKNVDFINENNIPLIFDPGQALPLFSGDELKSIIEKSDYVIANDYEAKLIEDKTGLSTKEIAEKVKAYIITLGPQGSVIYQKDQPEIKVDAIPVGEALDPTGCGDAFRGGVLYALENELDIKTAVQMGSVLGAAKISEQGPQNYQISLQAVKESLAKFYDVSVEV